MRFQTKITILLLLLSLLPLIVMGGIVYFQSKASLEKNIGTHFQYLSEEAVAKAYQQVRITYKRLEDWSRLEVMQDIITDDIDGRIVTFLLQKRREYPSLINLGAAGMSGKAVAAISPAGAQKDFSTEIFFQKAIKEGRPYVTDIRFDEQGRQWVMDFAFPIEDHLRRGKVIGVLTACWKADEISAALESHFRGRYSGGMEGPMPAVLLLRKDGLVIGGTASESRRIFRQNIYREGLLPRRGDERKQNGYFIRKETGRGNFLMGYSLGDVDKEGDLLRLKWGGVVLQEASRIFLPVRRLQGAFIGMGAVVMFCALFMALKVSGSIAKPVVQMATTADQVARGNLNTRVGYASNDELGMLAESFNKMTDALKTRGKELSTEKTYLNSVLNAAGEGVIVINAEGIVEIFNRTAQEMFGFRSKEVTGKHVTMLMPLAYREKHLSGFSRYIRTGRSDMVGKGHRELEGLRKDGNTFPIDLMVTEGRLPDSDRRIFIGMVRDITERKRIETEIKSAARFPAESPHPVMRLAKDGTILYANRASLPLLRAWGGEVGEAVRDYWREIIQDVLKRGKNRQIETACEDSIFSLEFVPFADFGYVNIYGLDITERKKADLELRESEARVGSIVKAAVDGIITVNEQGIIQLFNPAACKIFGYAAEEVVGRSVRLLMPEKMDREKYDQYLSNYARAGEEKIVGSRQEVSGRRKNGDTIPLDLSLSEMIMADGRRLFIGIVRDITERKRAEEEIRRAMAAKDDFTSMVSHELRTPLAISKEALSLILRNKVGEVPPQQREIVSMASANIDRLGYLINDILDAAKVSAGKMTLNKEMLDVVALVREGFEGWKMEAARKHIDFTLDVREKTLAVNVDRVRFMQILSNLLSNAIKFTPESGRVSVTVEEMADWVRFLIKDNGIGIAEADIPKIFQKFHQLQRVYGPGVQGTGLGLNITKSLVELHGGQIFVDSEEGKGTTFAFTIPKDQRKRE